MNTDIQRNSLLKILMLASLISTLIHNLDNYLRFNMYPQPSWITPAGIFRSWVIWTIVGIVGYFLYKNERVWLSYLCLLIYSACGLSSVAHYFYGSIHEFSFFMHLFILSDGLTGFAVLGFTLWSGLVWQKHERNVFTSV